jgi:hypothetical protein
VNPPATDNHMNAMEQEVQLAKQQCSDLKQYRLQLYEETEQIEKISIKNIREKLLKIKLQHQLLHQQVKEQKLINKKLLEQIKEIDNKKKTKKNILKMFSSDFQNDKKKKQQFTSSAATPPSGAAAGGPVLPPSPSAVGPAVTFNSSAMGGEGSAGVSAGVLAIGGMLGETLNRNRKKNLLKPSEQQQYHLHQGESEGYHHHDHRTQETSNSNQKNSPEKPLSKVPKTLPSSSLLFPPYSHGLQTPSLSQFQLLARTISSRVAEDPKSEEVSSLSLPIFLLPHLTSLLQCHLS